MPLRSEFVALRRLRSLRAGRCGRQGRTSVWLIASIVLVAMWLTFSAKYAIILGFLGLILLAVIGAVRSRVFRKRLLVGLAIAIPAAIVALGVRTWMRYRTAEVMVLPIREFTHAEYPEDPAARSMQHGMYDGRRLRLERKDSTHFDFIFESQHPEVATIKIKNVDVSLMTPSLPEWTKKDAGLQRIALTDRQWNRQQVRFGGPNDGRVEITGGNGWESTHLYSAELAKNCLNAGLWELLLFERVNGQKELYYQGWFTFPLGLYKEIFERSTGLSYWHHWYYLEHWFDPAGTIIPLKQLRDVVHESQPMTQFDAEEPIIAAGEQTRKRRTTTAENVRTWADFYKPNYIHFAAFIPPGRYSVSNPWSNEYPRMDQFEQAVLRKVRSPATSELVDELELDFSSIHKAGKIRFLVSGFQAESLPQLAVEEYPQGLYMPMGIGVPSFFQEYADLQAHPPNTTPYFSVLLDEDDHWVDHHHFAIDGPVMHRDAINPKLLHVYLLSYERHSLIGHWKVDLSGADHAVAARSEAMATP